MSPAAAIIDAPTLIIPSGNLRHRTTSPVSSLESVNNVNWASGWRAGIVSTSADYPTFRLRSTGSGKTSSIGNDADGGLWFMVNGSDSAYGTQAVTILPGGNVGIGTTTPYSILDISNIASGNNTAGISMFTGGYEVSKQWGTALFKDDTGGGIPIIIQTQSASTWYESARFDHGQSAGHPSFQNTRQPTSQWVTATWASGRRVQGSNCRWQVRLGGVKATRALG